MHSTIVFNDSSTIVTEKDSQYLKDEFTELEVKAPPAEVTVPTQNKVNKDSVAASAPNNNAIMNQSGLMIDYGTFKILLPGINIKEYKKQDPANSHGVSYQVIGGNLSKSQLVISGVKNMHISQRYQSNLTLEDNSQTLNLKNMGRFISDWEDLKVQQKGNQFVANLGNLNTLDFKQFSNSTLKNAVQKELHSKRANSQIVKDWMKAISSVHSAKDDPCEVKLDNVQWKLTGTDNQGKTINKLIRIDN